MTIHYEGLQAGLAQRMTDPDPEIRRIALMDLADLDDEAVIEPLLIEALQDKDANVRLEAAAALEGYESEEVVSALLGVLNDNDPRVAEASALSLAELKDARLGGVLLAALDNAAGYKKAAIFRALKELRVAGSLAPALLSMSDADAQVRQAAVSVLGYLRDDRALSPLSLVAVEDPDAEVRRIATGALGFSLTLPLIFPALIAALNDASWQVREEAVMTLGKLRAVDAIPELIVAMQDEYWQVRIKAARSLGRLKSREALPVLADALFHTISNLRKEAAVALGEIGDPAALPALEKALEDPDPDVRKLAKLAISQIEKHGIT